MAVVSLAGPAKNCGLSIAVDILWDRSRLLLQFSPHLIILSCICNFHFQTSCDYLRQFVIAGSATTLVAAFVKKKLAVAVCEPRKCQRHGQLLPPRAFSFSPNTMSDLSNCEFETGLADFFEVFLGKKKKKNPLKQGSVNVK